MQLCVGDGEWGRLGLFLAVEEPEEAFARRNFGKDFGQLYKPDYRSLKEENADVALKYIDGDPDSYPNIFENAKFKASEADRERLVEALRSYRPAKIWNRRSMWTRCCAILPYRFCDELGQLSGTHRHNYFLYEEDGILRILPWDYNLASEPTPWG